jgi:DNA-directed RNA polymerase specialized sigma24 family protein
LSDDEQCRLLHLVQEGRRQQVLGRPRARVAADAEAALIGEYLPLVRARAARMSSRSPAEREDLEQAGLIALWSSMYSYDLERGTPFAAYVEVAISRAVQNAAWRRAHRSPSGPTLSACLTGDEAGKPGAGEAIGTPAGRTAAENVALPLELDGVPA